MNTLPKEIHFNIFSYLRCKEAQYSISSLYREIEREAFWRLYLIVRFKLKLKTLSKHLPSEWTFRQVCFKFESISQKAFKFNNFLKINFFNTAYKYLCNESKMPGYYFEPLPPGLCSGYDIPIYIDIDANWKSYIKPTHQNDISPQCKPIDTLNWLKACVFRKPEEEQSLGPPFNLSKILKFGEDHVDDIEDIDLDLNEIDLNKTDRSDGSPGFTGESQYSTSYLYMNNLTREELSKPDINLYFANLKQPTLYFTREGIVSIRGDIDMRMSHSNSMSKFDSRVIRILQDMSRKYLKRVYEQAVLNMEVD